MDPYLEQPALWPDVHNRLIAAIADALAPQLRPRYYVAIEERTYAVAADDLVFAGRADVAVVEGRPDDSAQTSATADQAVVVVEVPVLGEVRETFLEVRSAAHERIVTVLEILSPANKRAGAGRTQYIDKRLGIFSTHTNLVELDLLRASEPMPVIGWSGRSDYRILISRGELRPRAELLPFSVRQPIPSPYLPLQPGDTEPRIEIGPILHALYDRASYDLRLNYRAEPDPPLSGDDATWADALLRAAVLR
jgi:hypothetical protein